MKAVLVFAMLEGTGGIEEFVLNLSRYKNDYGIMYDYIIIGETSVYSDEIKKLGRNCYFIPKKENLFANIIGWIKLFFDNRRKYDLVYFNVSGFYYPLPYIIAKVCGYNIVFHAHNTKDISRKEVVHFAHYFNRFYITKFTKTYYACSLMAGEWIYGKKLINQGIVQIVPNAIDLKRFTRKDIVKKKSINDIKIEGKFVIGNIARLSAVKNQQFLIKIFYEYLNYNSESLLMLVGSGETENELKKMVKMLNIEDKVIFYGNTKKPEELYEIFDCFVLPSLNEGFPITLVEAQAMGLKCFVSENVTKEVNITNNITYISLDASPRKWAEIIYDTNCTYYSAIDELCEKGYDISYMVNDMSRRFDAL